MVVTVARAAGVEVRLREDRARLVRATTVVPVMDPVVASAVGAAAAVVVQAPPGRQL